MFYFCEHLIKICLILLLVEESSFRHLYSCHLLQKDSINIFQIALHCNLHDANNFESSGFSRYRQVRSHCFDQATVNIINFFRSITTV